MTQQDEIAKSGSDLRMVDEQARTVVFEAVNALDVALAFWDEDQRYVFGNRLFVEMFSPKHLPRPGDTALDVLRLQMAHGFYKVPDGWTDEDFETSYCRVWCLSDHHAAAWADGLMPLMKSTPWMTSARWAKPRNLRQFFSAHCPSLNIMWSIPSRVRQPLVRLVR